MHKFSSIINKFMYLCRMIVCVAEKPSVGKDIAKVLGATQSHDGYMEGNGYQVTWTFGHLCGLLNPDEYTDTWKSWSLSSLPMIPPRFNIRVFDDKGVQKQFNTIKRLISTADEVINCGDAGQEGELIQRWVYQQAGCKCPVKRLWISSLTEDAIREGFSKLKDASEYQSLYEAGMMRAIGDWLLGMNATRAYTLRYRTENKQVLSIGRVQTPTLALIVKRQQEIEHFVPRTYWELKTTYRDTLFSLVLPEEEKETGIPTLEAGEALVAKIKDEPFTITKVEKKKGTEYAPKLFDLTTLQVECNKRMGMSAEETLQIAQSLYEKHVTTYPRVDTNFLSDDIYPKVPGILKGIDSYFPQVNRLREIMKANNISKLPKSKKFFDNKKVTDHHAIIPTGQAPNNITERERKVYDMIALRFIAAFYPDCQVANTTINGTSADLEFKTTGRQILVPGWREVFAKTVSDSENGSEKDNESNILPEFTKGESGVHTPQLTEKQTTPPKYYTEATLLRAMETAGKTVENEELRDAMKENGIGRPSTRAAIIEKLFQRRYIVKEKQNLKATQVGIDLIQIIHSPLLKSAELTGIWEKKLREIEKGSFQAKQFLDELKQMTTQVVYEVKTNKAGYRCPVCGKGTIIRGKTRYGCSRWREGCTYAENF